MDILSQSWPWLRFYGIALGVSWGLVAVFYLGVWVMQALKK